MARRQKKIRSPKCDPQRGPLYKAEREFEGCSTQHVASRDYLRALMRRVCNYYCVDPPALKFVNRPEQREYAWVYFSANSEFEDSEIFLNRGFHGQNAMTLVHELAHHIVDLHFDHHESHGPEFCAVYTHLLHKYNLIPQDAFRVVLKRWGVKIGNEYLPATLNAHT